MRVSAAVSILSVALATAQSQPASTAVQLRVDKYDLASSFDGTAAPAGRQYVIVQVRWANILTPAMPYLIPDIKTQLQLIVNGESGAKLVNGNFHDAGLLSPESQQIERGKDVSGRYVFEVPSPVTSLELAYFDKVYGNIRIPIMGKAPAPAAGAIAGPATSGGLTLTVLKVDETDAVGDARAPAGGRFVVVTALGSGAASVGDNYLEVDPTSVARLAEADGHLYPAAAIDNVEGVWTGMVRFVPGTPQRGRLVFTVPAQHGPLSLLVSVPGQPGAMRLPFSAAAAAPPKPPAPMLTIADGATGVFHLYGVRKTASGLVLDIGIENRTGSGMEFQVKEQIELLRGETEITATDEDLSGVRSLPEGGVVPPHAAGRWDIPFRVTGDLNGLTLYYRGFETEKKVPLPAVASK